MPTTLEWEIIASEGIAHAPAMRRAQQMLEELQRRTAQMPEAEVIKLIEKVIDRMAALDGVRVEYGDPIDWFSSWNVFRITFAGGTSILLRVDPARLR